MEKRFDRIESKIDTLHDKLSSIDATLIQQHEQLAYHIKRTDLLEDDIKPIKKHVAAVEGAIKFIGVLALFGGILEGIVALLTYVRH